ncbi:hypothetical protein D9M68_644060 [compost metagenome]
MVQPWFGSPTRFFAGTRTLSKKTLQKSFAPVRLTMGLTVMPGVFMSTSRKLMPCCFFAAGSVLASRNIMSASCASEVQIFWPLTTNSSPSSTADVRRAARSEPASGSEYPWHQ